MGDVRGDTGIIDTQPSDREGTTVDLSKFKTSDWLVVGGGAAFLIAGFLPWLEFRFAGFAGGSVNAFDFFFTGIIPWLLIVAIAALTFLGNAGIFKLPESFPVPTVFFVGAAVATLLVIIRFFYTQDLSRGIGLFLGLIAAIVVLVGSYMTFTASGGNLAELGKSIQAKTQGSGNQGATTAAGETTPPPPPPPAAGQAPPPPPPPPAN